VNDSVDGFGPALVIWVCRKTGAAEHQVWMVSGQRGELPPRLW
jgi:hypothetical protein